MIVSKRFAMELIRYKMIRYVKMLPAEVLILLRYGRIFVITVFVTFGNLYTSRFSGLTLANMNKNSL